MHVSRMIRSGVNLFASAFVLSLLGGCSAPSPDDAGDNEQALTTFSWKGHTWKVTSGGMAGVAQGNTNNVTVDANGYLHLKIVNNGGTWTASELFSTDKMGFGTYQWQIDAPIDRLDKNVVLGLFPYGPAAGIGTDGTNEIDIEYSRWGLANSANGDWTDYPASGNTIGELSYTFSLNGGTASTSRFVWSKSSITSSLMSGYQAPSSNAGLIKNWTYAPNNPTVNIPQQALPLGMNLWCFGAPPSNGQNVEVIIRDFQFIPEGSVVPPQPPTTNPPPTTTSSNIAGLGTAYGWSRMTQKSSNANRVARAGLNDGNTTVGVDLNSAGENGSAAWEAAGVLFSSAKTLSGARFVNGNIDGYGNGYLEAGLRLQYTTDGVTWLDLPWALAPAYPYNSTAGGKTYVFSGADLSGVLGMRIAGQTGPSSWSWIVNEVQLIGY